MKENNKKINVNVRITEREKEMLDEIQEKEGFHNSSDVFRFLLRHRYSRKYEYLREESS